MKAFAGDDDFLVADVDCTAAGKKLCMDNGVRGYPTIMYGEPGALQKYMGGRDFSALEIFAKQVKNREVSSSKPPAAPGKGAARPSGKKGPAGKKGFYNPKPGGKKGPDTRTKPPAKKGVRVKDYYGRAPGKGKGRRTAEKSWGSKWWGTPRDNGPAKAHQRYSKGMKHGHKGKNFGKKGPPRSKREL